MRFKNGTEDWIAFIGLLDDRPYEIFTGLAEEDVLPIPKGIDKGKIIKTKMRKTLQGTTSNISTSLDTRQLLKDYLISSILSFGTMQNLFQAY